MTKHRLVGRLSLILGLFAFNPACVGGEISGGSNGGARLGPEASDPGVVDDTSDPVAGGAESPLVCADASADVSASGGWQSSEASEPASGELSFAFKARPTAADLDGVVAVGAQQIDTFSEAAILVRFAEDGFVDAQDGGVYDSDVNYPYDPGVWYDVTVTADVQTKTYDVNIGRCGEPGQVLIEDASFRDDANVPDWLSGWAVWSSQSAALEISTPAWTASQGCAPATCETLGHVCGQPSDGCGGVLSCGACGAGEVCTSGACVDASVPPPPCEPATCQTLNAECGFQSNGCGGFVSCGSCTTGQMCSGGTCIDEPPPAPPPCVPATCQTLGAECGSQSDGCGGSLSCGGCGAGRMCSDGICIDEPAPPPPSPPPPPTGTPYGYVEPADVGVTIGLGVTAAVPTQLCSAVVPGFSNPIRQNGLTVENCVVNDCLHVDADNVTVRNVDINCPASGSYGFGTIYQTHRATNLTIEYSQISINNDGKAMAFDSCTNCTVRNNEIMGGQDFMFFWDNNAGTFTIENNYMHGVIGGPSAHSDGFQWWDAGGNGLFVIRGNYVVHEDSPAMPNDWLFTGDISATYQIENNYIGSWGWYTMRYHALGRNNDIIQNNVYAQEIKAELSDGSNWPTAAIYYDPQDNQLGLVYRCNRFEDGTFITNNMIYNAGPVLRHDTADCPSYP